MKDQDKCTHTKAVGGYWKSNPYYDARDDEGDAMDWVDEYEKKTFVDVDLHRYKCTQCGKMFYYSEAARAS